MVVVLPVRKCLLCLYGSFMGPTNQHFVKGPGNPYAEVVLGRCSGVQGRIQFRGQILVLLLTQHRS